MCFIYVDHVRTLKILYSPGFLPYLDNNKLLSIEDVILNFFPNIQDFLLELSVNSNEIPYIMAMYKFHKEKYRWISVVFGSI